MNAARSLCLLTILTLTVLVNSTSLSVQEPIVPKNELETRTELFDGVYVKFPEKNNTDKLISFELDTYGSQDVEEGRGKGGKKKGSKGKKKLIGKILPLFLMPFLLQSAIIPLVLGALKFMLFKSLIIGKVALALILLNAFKNNNSFKGRDAEIADVHYGYHGNGMEEYGAYVN